VLLTLDVCDCEFVCSWGYWAAIVCCVSRMKMASQFPMAHLTSTICQWLVAMFSKVWIFSSLKNVLIQINLLTGIWWLHCLRPVYIVKRLSVCPSVSLGQCWSLQWAACYSHPSHTHFSHCVVVEGAVLHTYNTWNCRWSLWSRLMLLCCPVAEDPRVEYIFYSRS